MMQTALMIGGFQEALRHTLCSFRKPGDKHVASMDYYFVTTKYSVSCNNIEKKKN